ncbi:hypothetical protein PENANT_c026G11787, partial [Penicillium antarcticum]
MIRLDDTDACALAQTPTLKGKLRALTSLMNNQRCIGTPYEIKWIPPFDESRPGYIPSRAEALRSVATQIVTGYLSRQVLVSFLWDILPLGLFWCLYIASWLNSLYMAGDLIALISGDPVEAHPPAFGSIRYMRTIRGFWGKYWHQSNSFPFQGASNYICKELLGLRSLVQRYTNILSEQGNEVLLRAGSRHHGRRWGPGALETMAWLSSGRWGRCEKGNPYVGKAGGLHLDVDVFVDYSGMVLRTSYCDVSTETWHAFWDCQEGALYPGSGYVDNFLKVPYVYQKKTNEQLDFRKAHFGPKVPAQNPTQPGPGPSTGPPVNP